MRDVVFRADQALFLRGRRHEHHRSLRRSPAERARDFQQLRDAAGVVDGPVVDLIAGAPFVTSEMVPMPGVHDHFVATCRVAAGQDRDDVGTRECAVGAREVNRQLGAARRAGLELCKNLWSNQRSDKAIAGW